ncbi:MAG: Rieske 2Fe-2S domain-containing protein [Chloroflexi bacterium]|nr:Rieske 2Fe-2S domain-containing protein [Chloroflexota bacterium]
MLTQEENDLLTQVGPGTPGGELLRRYWHPVAVSAELTHEHPTRFVRILGEDLVLFKDKSGRVGLLADHCSHRGASLLYGRVEERGISCAYHGWLYDCEGNILETPPERNDAIMRSVKHTAYPVRKFIGLYWAYLGPSPMPVIPPYDIWVRKDGTRKITVRPVLDCNWFQPMENSADSPHLEILHQAVSGREAPANTTRGFIDDVESYDYHVEEWGALIKTRVYKNGEVDHHPLIFPNVLRVGNRTQIRVPIDDTHTWHVVVAFTPTEDGSIVEDVEDLPFSYDPPYKDPPDARYPSARNKMDTVPQQDYMVWETQGAVANRTAEHLSFGDRGVVLLRNVLRENIERVQAGLDPLGLVRDPDLAMIDTNLDESIEMERRGRPVGSRAGRAANTRDT